jgi:anti-sigma factor RsiW
MTATPWQAHVDADSLERYALNQLSEEASATIEEHLLLCPLCQRRLQETDEFVNALRAESCATRRLEPAGVRSNVRISSRPLPHRA